MSTAVRSASLASIAPVRRVRQRCLHLIVVRRTVVVSVRQGVVFHLALTKADCWEHVKLEAFSSRRTSAVLEKNRRPSCCIYFRLFLKVITSMIQKKDAIFYRKNIF